MRARCLLLAAIILAVPLATTSCKKSDSKKKAPEITALVPDTGREGDVVIIEGRGFAKKITMNKVIFNGVEAQILLARNTKLTVLVPVGSRTGPVKVTRGNLESNEVPFTVLLIPTITALVPDWGPEGTVVTIQGRYFGLLPQDNIIRLGSQIVPALTAAQDELTFFIPPGAVSDDVTVEVPPDMSNAVAFEVTSPKLTRVEEFFGSEGSAIVLSGENFSPLASENIVRFNGVQAPVLFASSFGDSLSTVVPIGTRSGPVTVEVVPGRGITNGLPFCLDGSLPPAPSIGSVSPGSGAVGDPIRIDGSNFSPNHSDNEIRFNGTLAPTLRGSTSRLYTRVPAGAISGPITVEVAGQIGSFVNFSVTTPAPPPPGLIGIVSERTPMDTGAEGDWVIIRGSDFSAEPSDVHVYFNGVEGRVAGASPAAILAYVPFTSSGLVTVDVGGRSTPAGLPFTVLGPPATGTTFTYFGMPMSAPSDSVIFVIDISGTMNWSYGSFTDRFGNPVAGTRLDLAVDRTAAAINTLLDGVVTFNIVAFDCGPISWDPVGQVASGTSKAAAISWLTALAPSGSSDTGRAVASALAMDPFNRTITLVSDGSPTCGPTSEASHLCEILTANTQGATIHTFAIQPFGEFAAFMQDLSSLTGGTYSIAN